VNNDDTQDPLIGHGLAQYAEPYPLDVADRLARLQRISGELEEQLRGWSEHVDKMRVRLDRAISARQELHTKVLILCDTLRTARDRLAECGNGHMVARINDILGDAPGGWDQPALSVPIQGQ